MKVWARPTPPGPELCCLGDIWINNGTAKMCVSRSPQLWSDLGPVEGGVHTHTQSEITDFTHDHGLLYSGLSHNHDSSYSGVVHSHNYADTSHVHDYSPTSHVHQQIVKLNADISTTLTTLSNVGLSFALSPGYYSFRFLVLFRTPLTTTGIRLGLTFPASICGATVRIPIAADGVGGELQGWITSSGDSVLGTAVQSANTDYLAIIDGVINPSVSGTLQLQFASEVSGSSVTIRRGSCGVL